MNLKDSRLCLYRGKLKTRNKQKYEEYEWLKTSKHFAFVSDTFSKISQEMSFLKKNVGLHEKYGKIGGGD